MMQMVSGARLNKISKWQIPIALLMCLSFASPVLAQEKAPANRAITVTGRGVESIPTTLTQVQLGVEVQGKTAQEVQQDAAQRSSRVVGLLKSRNVEKLQTTGISLNPTYSYTNNVQRLTGYTATNSVSFRISTERSGNILDEAVKAGATRIDSISFVASDEALSFALQQALKKATQDAQKQADTVLGTLGLKAQQVLSIQVNQASPPQPRVYEGNFAKLSRSAAPAPTPVVGGEQQVDAAVTLEIGY